MTHEYKGVQNMRTLAQILGYKDKVFPHRTKLKNGKGLLLVDENSAYLDDMGYGQSNPCLCITPYFKGNEKDVWRMIANRFDRKNPAKYAKENLI